ncbi:MAG TPA: Ku protein, partial [Solirubrobacteraceae bacterium]|nr:Ku protein [Solirubrobacteraceae bacterium]
MRSIWNGTITVGTIAVPIKVHSANEDRTVHFHEVHAEDGARIEHKRICPREREEVPYSEIVKGFEIAPDEYVVLDKEEIAAAGGGRSRMVEIEEFVDAAAIDPVY